MKQLGLFILGILIVLIPMLIINPQPSPPPTIDNMINDLFIAMWVLIGIIVLSCILFLIEIFHTRTNQQPHKFNNDKE
jgi:hypothetical protein